MRPNLAERTNHCVSAGALQLWGTVRPQDLRFSQSALASTPIESSGYPSCLDEGCDWQRAYLASKDTARYEANAGSISRDRRFRVADIVELTSSRHAQGGLNAPRR